MMKVKALCLLVLFSSANYAAIHPVRVNKNEIISYSYLLYKNAELISHGEQSLMPGEPFSFSYVSAGKNGIPISDMNLYISSCERNGFLYSNLDFGYSETGELSAPDTPAYKRLRLQAPLFMKSGERRTIRLNDDRYTLKVSARINSD